MWYTLYLESDGTLVGHSSTPADPVPDGRVMIETPDRMDQTHVWDSGSISWVTRPVSRMVRPAALFGALTTAELKAFCESTGNGVTACLRAIDILSATEKISKDSPVANQMLQWLVDDGVISAQRKTELLA